MHLIQVDTVRLKAPQARLAGPLDVQGRQATLIRPLAHPAEHLRCQDDFLTPSPALGEPTPHDLLRPPFARLPAIDVRRVEKVEAQLQRPIHDGETVRLARLRAEVHRAKTESADFHSRPTEMNVLHE